jgi:hypothetical protein
VRHNKQLFDPAPIIFTTGNNVTINIEAGGANHCLAETQNSNSQGSFNVNGLQASTGIIGQIMDRSIWKQQLRSLTLQAPWQHKEVVIHGPSNDCNSNCSGALQGCGPSSGQIKASHTATIVPDSQTVCANGVNYARIRY